MQKVIVFGVVRALHDLFTALWIGGMLTTILSFMPVFKKFKGKLNGLNQILVFYQKKLSVFAIISIFGLWLTGLLLGRQSPAYSGFLNFSTTPNILLSLKHLLIFVMILIALYRRFILGNELEKLDANGQKFYGILLMVNALLGVVVLFLSGIGASIAQVALMSMR